ncbi:MAG: PAS domain S-box protein [Chloroflexi bacterium]|nr:PAS domain S-box protein [Chloroflexota bacterium]
MTSLLRESLRESQRFIRSRPLVTWVVLVLVLAFLAIQSMKLISGGTTRPVLFQVIDATYSLAVAGVMIYASYRWPTLVTLGLLVPFATGYLFAVFSKSPLDFDMLAITLILLSISGLAIILIARLRSSQTESEQAKQQIQELQQYLQLQIDNMPIALIAWDREFRVQTWNPMAEKIFGYPAEEMLGRQAASKVPPEVLQRLSDLWQGHSDMKSSGHLVCTSVTADDRTIVCEWVNALIRRPDGAVVGAISMAQDVTERSKAETERLKFAKLESVGTLAGGIAHDFNNLLTVVLGRIELAQEFGEVGQAEALRKALAEAERVTLRATNLSHQLLTFAKGGTPVKKLTSVRRVIEDSASFSLKGSNVRCEFSFPDDLWAAEVDEGQIGQVISNLVINARQAMPGGGTVLVAARNISLTEGEVVPLSGGRYLLVNVEDHGIGIPREHWGRMFEPYFTTKPSGSGLGLATSYSIVKSHGGTITVSSVEGVGTTFQVYLPASAKQPITAEDQAGGASQTAKSRVLVMDDEDEVRLLVGELLAHDQHEVELARDGAEAIEKFRNAANQKKPFDIVILDLTVVGGMGGIETIKELIRLDPDVVALASSGYATSPVMSEYRKYGFAGVVAKPYTLAQLREALRQVLERPKLG